MSIEISKLKNGNYQVVNHGLVLPNNKTLKCECKLDGYKLKVSNPSHYHNAKNLAQSIFSINLGSYYRFVSNMKVGDKIII